MGIQNRHRLRAAVLLRSIHVVTVINFNSEAQFYTILRLLVASDPQI